MRYIHGEGDLRIERERLVKQATMLWDDLWKNIDISKFKLSKALPFLEVGCGVCGQTPHLLKKIPRDVTLYCIDKDKKQILKAKQNLKGFRIKKMPKFMQVNAKRLPFKNNTFGGVYISWVLEHMTKNDAIKVLNEIYRILHKDGVLILNEVDLNPNRSWIISDTKKKKITKFARRFLKVLIQEQYSGSGNPEIGEKELITGLVKKVGFSRVKYQRTSMHYDVSNKVRLRQYQNYIIDLWKSVFPALMKRNKIKPYEFEMAICEIKNTKILRQETGQIIAIK